MMLSIIRIVILLLLTVWCNKCLCDICKTCECVTTDSGLIAYCRGKFRKDDETLNYGFLTLDKHQVLHKLVHTGNSGTVLLTSQILNKIKNLKQMDLSGNLLVNVHEDVFKVLSSLEDLSYSNNCLSSFDIAILNANSPLLKLNLSHNEINNLERSSQSVVTGLKMLDLSHNNLTDIYQDFLVALPQLEYLDLSFNKFSSLEANSLTYLQYLKILRINDNRFLSLDFQNLPLRLDELHAGGNLISVLLPKKMSIQVLNIENNQISDLKDYLTLLKELRYLNVSGNSLSGFPTMTLKHLKSIDCSFNNLTTIPDSISTKNFPLLRTLNFSGNRLQDLSLQSELKLDVFEAYHLDMIEEIHKDTFWKLTERANGCINVTISNSKKLSVIAEDVFRHMNVCSLDLSNNHFTQFPLKLIDDSKSKNAHYLINLQGNPFVCNCSLQWMLDDLVPYLYKMEPSLLEELRCARPASLTNIRLVHWYQWRNKVFCDDLSEKLVFKFQKVTSQQAATFSFSKGMLVALSITVTILAILIIIAVILTRKMIIKKRRINRRF
ncbi:leucine-rich repeats and immunoglobulin-like domains protein 1 [Odontomachus brunneus]|uniref:leucine-rich repeats and immunoglobulin-like domains protein 1 n=1 Tax=Odontomachus brunneus TaxID=486640 RepID=UPI0013F2599E|nr:leucine-rich repeats and immunoglobulin-like domains protein 1 [Odontomachus brunneus]